MKKIKKKLAGLLIGVILAANSITSFAITNGVNDSYALYHISNAPSSESVYSKQWTFYASKKTTTITATMNTTGGAHVLAASSNGISALLDTKGVSSSANATIGQIIVAEVSLSLNGTSTDQRGTGTISG